MNLSSATFLAIGVAAISIGCATSRLPAAGDPFVGDWKLDASRTTFIDIMKVQPVSGDTYAFDFEGGGGETIVVDGTDQPGIAGTTLAVTAGGPAGWKVVRKKAGRMMITALWKLSADGNTLSDDFTEFAPDGQVATHVTHLYRRTADGAGFAGTWESPIPRETLPSSVLQIRPSGPNGLAFNYVSLQLLRNFELDGKDHPVHGVAGGTTSSARRVDQRTLEVTDKSKDQITKTERIEVSPDLGTLTHTARPAGQREPNVLVYQRQPRTTPAGS